MQCHIKIKIYTCGMFTSASPTFFKTIYFIHLCTTVFVAHSFPLPKHSILPYVLYPPSHHSSSSSYAPREHARSCANHALPRKTSNTGIRRASSPPLRGTQQPPQSRLTEILLHSYPSVQTCHQTLGCRQGWLLTTAKPSISGL